MKDCLMIGDIHLRTKSVSDFLQLKEKVLQVLKENEVRNIVFMGDLLDTNDIVRVSLHVMLTEFIAQLLDYKVFILIGNHDYASPTQFLTDKHIFGPLKKWKNVWIVDEPIVYGDSLLMPYVPPGKFLEAIGGVDLSVIKRIFCHQSFLPLIKFSEDYWDPRNPIKIYSGHIHDHCSKQNLFYTGSSLQVSAVENPNKKLWLLSREDALKPIPLKIRGVMTKKCTPDELFTLKLSKLHENRIVIKGKREDYKLLSKKSEYRELEQLARIEWDYIEESLTKEQKGYFKIDFRATLKKMLTVEEAKFLEGLSI